MALVTIRNKQTGETKQVDSSELSKYGVTQSQPETQKPLGGLIPVGTATIAGILGSLFGTPLLGAGAAGGGYIAGKGIESGLAGNPLSAGSNLGMGPAQATGNQLLGSGIAKGAGFLTHPIAPFTNMATRALTKSPAMIDIGKFLSDLFSQGTQKFAKNVVGSEFTPAYNKVATDISSAVPELTKHIAGTGQASNVVQNLIPALTANSLKSGLQQGSKEFYGAVGPTDIEMRKLAAYLLRQELESAVSGIKVPNAIAAGMHKIPNALEDLTYALPWRTGILARHVGQLPAKAIQKAIPESGGFLNYLLPALFQALNQ